MNKIPKVFSVIGQLFSKTANAVDNSEDVLLFWTGAALVFVAIIGMIGMAWFGIGSIIATLLGVSKIAGMIIGLVVGLGILLIIAD